MKLAAQSLLVAMVAGSAAASPALTIIRERTVETYNEIGYYDASGSSDFNSSFSETTESVHGLFVGSTGPTLSHSLSSTAFPFDGSVNVGYDLSYSSSSSHIEISASSFTRGRVDTAMPDGARMSGGAGFRSRVEFGVTEETMVRITYVSSASNPLDLGVDDRGFSRSLVEMEADNADFADFVAGTTSDAAIGSFTQEFVLTPGTHEFDFRVTTIWSAMTAEGVTAWDHTADGYLRIEIIPAPASGICFGIFGLAATRRRR